MTTPTRFAAPVAASRPAPAWALILILTFVFGALAGDGLPGFDDDGSPGMPGAAVPSPSGFVPECDGDALMEGSEEGESEVEVFLAERWHPPPPHRASDGLSSYDGGHRRLSTRNPPKQGPPGADPART